MKKTHKLLALVLSVIMVLSILPVIPLTACAETDGIFKYKVEGGEATITGLVDKSYSGELTIPLTINGYPVTSIGGNAFCYCTELTSIIIPDSVASIDNCAFWGCNKLNYITIPHSITSISDYAFWHCSRLTSITIPDSVTSIGVSAFEGCAGLTSITIPNSVTSIGGYAFRDCLGLTSIVIPDSVTSMYYAFVGCDGLESITVKGTNFVYHSDSNCIIETNSKKLILGCKKSVIPDDGSVTSIGDWAFSGCNGLTSVTIPDSVTEIGYDAFSDCLELTSITIPNSVTSIGESAFHGCEKLKNIRIPDSITLISGRMFENCSGLTNITIPSSVKSVDEYAFCHCLGLTSITIPDSVTTIGGAAFLECSALTSVTIGNSLTTIGVAAFEGCKGLTSITIPDSVTSICEYAFSGCTGLTSVTIPDSVTSIGEYAFDGCAELTSVTIGNSVTLIGECAFDDCTGLTDVYYTGTEQQKSAIVIDYGNYCLLNSNWHYNYVPGTPICTHANTEVKGKKAATEEAKGYTGDTYCKSCGAKLASGKSIDKLVINYKITYKLDGGKDPKNPTTYTYATSTITLKNPTKKGYTFKGWYNGSNKVTKIEKGSKGNITLTAKWAKDTYKITYKLAGGKKVKNPATYTVTTSTIKLKNPTKKGYKFVGWYNGSKKVTEIKKGSTGNLTLTAKWKVITYKITYKLNKGKNNSKNPKSYKVTTSTIKLKDPTRKGYTFKGWYSNSKFNRKVTKIVKGSTGNVTLYAKWVKKK